MGWSAIGEPLSNRDKEIAFARDWSRRVLKRDELPSRVPRGDWTCGQRRFANPRGGSVAQLTIRLGIANKIELRAGEQRATR